MTSRNNSKGWGQAIYNSVLANPLVIGGLVGATAFGVGKGIEHSESIQEYLNPQEEHRAQEEDYQKDSKFKDAVKNEANINKSGDNRVEDSKIVIEEEDIVNTYPLEGRSRHAYEVDLEVGSRFIVPHDHGYAFGRRHRRRGGEGYSFSVGYRNKNFSIQVGFSKGDFGTGHGGHGPRYRGVHRRHHFGEMVRERSHFDRAQRRYSGGHHN